MEPLTLTTGRLLLRPFTPDDADAVHAACQDPAIQRWTSVPSPYEREHAQHWTRVVVPDDWRTGRSLDFAVVTPADGSLVGAIGIRGTGPVREVGFWTAAGHRGNGYTLEALTALARWAFTEQGCGRLEWRAEVGNAGSRAVAEKAGFRVEGVLRAALPNKGTLRDCWVGGLLPSDLGLPGADPYLPAGD